MKEERRQVIGLVMVRNEDCFIAQVLENISEFCDKIIITDHHSVDATPILIQRFCEANTHAEMHTIDNLSESHLLIEPYAGGRNWIFAVDGDEVYDPTGLNKFKTKLLAGAYDKWWLIFGNVLNCTHIDSDYQFATGYLAPPCRSMTKLYNFFLIDSWNGSSGERLHGGKINFKNGYDQSLRYNLYDETSWENAEFRCLHMCFLQRSRRQRTWRGRFLPRPNPADIMSRNHFQRIAAYVKELAGIPNVGKQEWKIEKFTRGPEVQKDISQFFPK